jgi:hemoglobin
MALADHVRMLRTAVSPAAALPAFIACTFVLAGPAPAAGQGSEAAEVSAASLYERLGGLPAIARIVDDFMAEFTADPLILANPAVRERKSPENAPYITFQVTTLVCQATGGPCTYTGADMRSAHAGLNVSQAEWERMAEIFAATLTRHGVGEQEQEELFEILGPNHAEIVVPGGG